MYKIELLISDIMTDLDYEYEEGFSKEAFLAEQTYKKIQKRTSVYTNTIDKYIEALDQSEFNRKSLVRLSRTLTNLSNIATQSYQDLLEEIERMERIQEHFQKIDNK